MCYNKQIFVSFFLWFGTAIFFVLFSKQAISLFPKRGLMDQSECEKFYLSSGFQAIFKFVVTLFIMFWIQGHVGNCTCGYNMFSKRSSHTQHQDMEMNANQVLHHLSHEPVLTEGSMKEIPKDLKITEDSHNDDYPKNISEKEVTEYLSYLIIIN